MVKHSLTRRSVLAAGAAAAFATPFVRGAHAAGRLNVAFWDHWVPGANDVMRSSARNGPTRKRSTSRSISSPRTGDKLR